MLAELTDILRGRGLLKPDEQAAFNVSLISGEQLTLQAFARDGARLHVRVKRRGVVPEEYESCCEAWRSFPQYAPEPLGRQFTNGWEIILVTGIGHDAVSMGDIGRNRHGLVEKLISFFAASRAGRGVARSTETHAAFLRRIRDRAADPGCVAIFDEWIESDELERVPRIAQHGDFTVNNLGLNKGRLVVFDWEDFGKVSLPGFDLCTAIASDVGLDSGRLDAAALGASRASRRYRRLLEQSCPPLGLTPALFRRLTPLYLAIFLDLKSGYGEPVRLAVRELIRGLDKDRR